MPGRRRNGGRALFEALVEAGIDTCFANPGTSEMQLIYESGLSDDMQPYLCLHENVATGAADGYNRMTGRPALALLHMGAGLANGLANLHNARKAGSGMVVLVGDNADFQFRDVEHGMLTPIAHLAAAVSDFVKTTESADDLAVAAAQAARVAKSGQGKIATVVSPTNHHWEPATVAVTNDAPPPVYTVAEQTIEEICTRLTNRRRTALVLDKRTSVEGLETAGKVAAKTGAHLMAPTFFSRLPRGDGRVVVEPIPYLPEHAVERLKEFEQMILLGTKYPTTTFAYEGRPIVKVPDGCDVITMGTEDVDTLAALQTLCTLLGADEETGAIRYRRVDTAPPSGELNAMSLAQSLTALLPSGCIVVDESATLGLALLPQTAGAAPHDWLLNPAGGAIGAGLPVALGAAVACRDRKVIALQADGSGMYTPQALWSIARDGLDVTVVILRNDRYAILEVELARVRQSPANDKMMSMLELNRPTLDWVKIAGGMGIEASSASTAEAFHQQLESALAQKGPRLIEACAVQDLSPFVNLVSGGR